MPFFLRAAHGWEAWSVALFDLPRRWSEWFAAMNAGLKQQSPWPWVCPQHVTGNVDRVDQRNFGFEFSSIFKYISHSKLDEIHLAPSWTEWHSWLQVPCSQSSPLTYVQRYVDSVATWMSCNCMSVLCGLACCDSKIIRMYFSLLTKGSAGNLIFLV